MMIGYCESRDVESIVKLKNHGCDTVELYEPRANLKEQFELFLEKNKKAILVVTNYESLGLPLIQYNRAFDLIETENIDFRLLDDEISATMLKNLVRYESRIIKMRTKRGIDQAKSEGRVGGRPKIAPELVDRIVFLYTKHGLTLRQISEECQVSLGTVYKYCKKCQE